MLQKRRSRKQSNGLNKRTYWVNKHLDWYLMRFSFGNHRPWKPSDDGLSSITICLDQLSRWQSLISQNLSVHHSARSHSQHIGYSSLVRGLTTVSLMSIIIELTSLSGWLDGSHTRVPPRRVGIKSCMWSVCRVPHQRGNEYRTCVLVITNPILNFWWWKCKWKTFKCVPNWTEPIVVETQLQCHVQLVYNFCSLCKLPDWTYLRNKSYFNPKQDYLIIPITLRA